MTLLPAYPGATVVNAADVVLGRLLLSALAGACITAGHVAACDDGGRLDDTYAACRPPDRAGRRQPGKPASSPHTLEGHR